MDPDQTNIRHPATRIRIVNRLAIRTAEIITGNSAILNNCIKSTASISTHILEQSI